MDNAYFLLTDLGLPGPGESHSHSLVHNLTRSCINSEVFICVDDFDKIRPLRLQFPSATFFLLDLSRNTGVNKGLLRLLPDIECYLNYAGEPFSHTLTDITEIFIDKECSYESNSINIFEIAQELRENIETGCVLINVVVPVSSRNFGNCHFKPPPPPSKPSTSTSSTSKTKPLSSILKKPPRPPSPLDYTHTIQPTPPAPPVVFRLSAKYRKPPSIPFYATERQPLLPRSSSSFRRHGRNYTDANTSVNASASNFIPPTTNSCQSQSRSRNPFLACLECFCHPIKYCCSSGDSASEFTDVQHLRRHVRQKRAQELKRLIGELFTKCEEEWREILDVLAEKEEEKVEKLVQRVSEKRDLEEEELSSVADEQNAQTSQNLVLTGVLDEGIMAKIASSRERHVRRKVGWNTEQRFSEGRELIRRAGEMERVVKRDEHYSKTLVKQFNLMQAVKDRWDRREERWTNKYFGGR